MAEILQFIECNDCGISRRLAVRSLPGGGPTVVWAGGFRSDMLSTKAQRLADWARDTGRGFVRFDYTGHGESGGRFEEGTISLWRADTRAVLERCTAGPVILVGSSMGGWISLLIARELADRGETSLAGLVLIAPAVDFTETLMWAAFPDDIRRQITDTGVWFRPSAYAPEPYPITSRLIEDGRQNLMYGQPFRVGCPVHVLQGRRDPDVPCDHVLKLAEHLPLDPVTVTIISDGDHRLSRDEDIARLLHAVETIAPAP
jgi:pimeloyl-ACP methyl ester carboxylesterase